MSLYRRRIFYSFATGEVLRSYTAMGDLKREYPPEREAADVGLENWGVFDWDKPDAEIDAAMSPVDADGNPRTCDGIG